MTTITFERAWSFNAGTGYANDAWLHAVLSDSSRYTIQTNAPDRLVVVATPASGLAGYTVVLTPVTTFAAASGTYPITGAIDMVRLYDPTGALVSTVSDIPPAIAQFSSVSSSLMMGVFGADLIGSSGADTLGGYRSNSDGIDGGAGDDRLMTGNGDDVIIGGAGADTIESWGGDDLIVGGLGADRIDAGAGFDIVFLDEATGRINVWLSQPGAPDGVRVDNAELIVLGDFGATVWGGMPGEFILGGAGADQIDGGGGDDGLAGGEGNDTLTGDIGADILDGGPGADLLDGGAGYDLADYSLAPGGLTIDLRITTAQQTGFGLDTLRNVEAIYGSDFADTLTGDAQGNGLAGAAGDDLLTGGLGDDSLAGGAGADRAFGGEGNDTLGDEAGSNYLRGEEGDDLIFGGADFDDAHGNQGNDTVYGGLGDDWVVGGKDHDLLYGDEDHDVVYGNLGEDTVNGGAGNDWVRGGQGDDVVRGDAGDDWIAGDRGNDTLTGGAGADLFHTWGDAGLDRVTDFNAAEGDRVNLLAGTTYTVAQVGADTVITMDGGAQMILEGVQLSALPEGWIFGA